MTRMIFINLPVDDLPRSIAFYEAIGAGINPQFSDETAACMVVSDVINVMLLSHDKWGQFTSKTIPDAHVSAQMLLCLSADTKDAVDAMVVAAASAGGKGDPIPTQDYPFMFGRSFEDPDGHIWEIMWMNPAAAQPE